jgi:serine/threonine protein kinase
MLLKEYNIVKSPSHAVESHNTIRMPDGTKRIRLGSGVVTSLLSRGGTAYVYEIWNPELEIRRAVKLLDPAHIDESKERFEREIKISAKLHHSNIVEIYDIGKWNELPYIEMERVDGYTLEEMIGKFGALPLEVCTAVGIMVSRALHYAHHQKYMIYGKEYHGVIHRDLKPGNIMMGRDGIVKLMDFGIAKPMAAPMRTCEGEVFGTMQYLAPEQLQEDNVDIRADIYSFGAVLYECITGRRTFPEDNLAKLVTDKLNNNYRSLDEYAVKIHPQLKALVHRCLLYEKEKRIQNAVALVKNLESIHDAISQQKPEEAVESFFASSRTVKRTIPLHRQRFRLHFLLPVVTVCIVIATLAYAAFSLYRRNRETQDILRSAETVSSSVNKTAAETGTPEQSAAESATGDAAAEMAERKMAPGSNAPAVQSTPSRSTRSSPPSSPSPQRAPRTPKKTVSLRERLSARYGTGDIVTMIQRALDSEAEKDAYRLFTYVEPEALNEPKTGILYLRTLQELGYKKSLAEYLSSHEVNDGEFYLSKAQFYFSIGNYKTAEKYYQKSIKVPGTFIDPDILQKQQLYGRAQVASALFDSDPNDQTKKRAMDRWYEIKLRLRTSPDHPLYKKADSEIRRISTSSTDGE